jgi:hypothetical protein
MASSALLSSLLLLSLSGILAQSKNDLHTHTHLSHPTPVGFNVTTGHICLLLARANHFLVVLTFVLMCVSLKYQNIDCDNV